jgi:hypothetical protein
MNEGNMEAKPDEGTTWGQQTSPGRQPREPPKTAESGGRQ